MTPSTQKVEMLRIRSRTTLVSGHSRLFARDHQSRWSVELPQRFLRREGERNLDRVEFRSVVQPFLADRVLLIRWRQQLAAMIEVVALLYGPERENLAGMVA
jgi:hypothetical protein